MFREFAAAPPRLQAEDAAEAVVDGEHDVRGNPAGAFAQVALVDGDQGGDGDDGVAREAARRGWKETLPGSSARAVFEVTTAASAVERRLALNGSAWTINTGRRFAGRLPRAGPRSTQ
jgi:hypothetical protein